MDSSDWEVPPPGRKIISDASVISPVPAGGDRKDPEDFGNKPSTSATGKSHPSPVWQKTTMEMDSSDDEDEWNPPLPRSGQSYSSVIPPISSGGDRKGPVENCSSTSAAIRRPSPFRKHSRSAYEALWQNTKLKKREQYKDIIPPIPPEEFARDDDGLNYNNVAVPSVAISPADEEDNALRRSQQWKEKLKNTRIYEAPQLSYLKSNSKAQFIGIGEKGLVLIKLKDASTIIQFEKHQESMNSYYNCTDNAGGKLRMPRDEIDINRIVVVLWKGKQYVRGRVLQARAADGRVLVRDLDTWTRKYVPADNIFYIVPQCLQSPLMVAMVKLKHLELWHGTWVLMEMIPIIYSEFNETVLIKQCEKDADGVYSTIIVVTLKARTNNKLAIDDEHITLNVFLMQTIAGFTRIPKMFFRGFMASASHVSIAEGNGEVWIQMESYLSHKLGSLGEVPFKTENNSLEEDWSFNALSDHVDILNFHDAYFERGDRVFVARFLEDRSFYRAKILQPILEGAEEAVVQYLDFGNTETIPIADILPVDCFDHVLSKIPMQVFRGYLNGIDSIDDIDEFFEVVDISLPQKVVISGFKEPGRVPLLDVFILQNKEDTELTYVNQMLIDKKIAKGRPKITPIISHVLRQPAPAAPKTVSGNRKNPNKCTVDGNLKRFYAGCRIIKDDGGDDV